MFWLVTPLVDGQQTDPPYDGQTESCESIYYSLDTRLSSLSMGVGYVSLLVDEFAL